MPATPRTAPDTTAAPVRSTPPAPSASAASLPSEAEDVEQWEMHWHAGSIETDGPVAPCDYGRLYRGKVGDAALSVTLSRAGPRLWGSLAYDAGFGELEAIGQVGADGQLTLAEMKGARPIAEMKGQCDPATGRITGTYVGAGAAKDVVLEPRAAGGVPLVQRARKIGQWQQDRPSCHWDVRRPAVFGLKDPARTKRINGALQVRFIDANEADMERQVRSCPAGESRNVSGWYSIEANADGLLSVLTNGYVYFGPAAHGWFNAAAAAVSIDIPTGRKLALTDVVTSSKAIRPLVHECMEMVVKKADTGDVWGWERSIQGVPTDGDGNPVEETEPTFDPRSLYEPTFIILPDGLAVLIRGMPTVGAGFELRGPVLRWDALKRAGVLAPRSPVRRLWAKVPPVSPTEPPCARMFVPRWFVKTR